VTGVTCITPPFGNGWQKRQREENVLHLCKMRRYLPEETVQATSSDPGHLLQSPRPTATGDRSRRYTGAWVQAVQ